MLPLTGITGLKRNKPQVTIRQHEIASGKMLHFLVAGTIYPTRCQSSIALKKGTSLIHT